MFPGGCTLESAEEVCDADADTLQSLLDKSLLRRRDTERGSRFWMLETVRQFAAGELDRRGELPTLEERFAAWALADAERAEPHLRGSDQLLWMAGIDDELDNFRSALAHLLERGAADRPLRLLNALSWHFGRRGRFSELGESFGRALAFPTGDLAVRCRALLWVDPHATGDRNLQSIQEALKIARSIGDPRLEGYALEMHAMLLIEDTGASESAHVQDETLELLRQAGALYDRSGAADDAARLAINGAAALLVMGRDEQALATAEDATARTRTQGNRHGTAVALLICAHALTRLEGAQAAATALIEAFGLLRELSEAELHGGYGFCLAAAIAAARGEDIAAARLIGVWDGVSERLGSWDDPAEIELRAGVLAVIELRLGRDRVRAERLGGRSLDAEASLGLAEKAVRDAVAE